MRNWKLNGPQKKLSDTHQQYTDHRRCIYHIRYIYQISILESDYFK